MSSLQRLLCCPLIRWPSFLPSRMWVQRSRLWWYGWSVAASASIVLQAVQLIHSGRLWQSFSNTSGLLTSAALTVKVSHPYSATSQTNFTSSFILIVLFRARSFHRWERERREDLAALRLALIPQLQSAVWSVMETESLNFSTCSNLTPRHRMFSCSGHNLRLRLRSCRNLRPAWADFQLEFATPCQPHLAVSGAQLGILRSA